MSCNDLQSAIDSINSNADNIVDVELVTNSFRFLRNLCGTNSEAQNEIIKTDSILSNTKKILMSVMSDDNEDKERLLCLQVGIQFLANLIVNNKNNQKIVWSSCQDLLDLSLKYNNAKVQNCCSMILYNIFLGKPEYLDDLKHPYEDLITLTTQENTSEFSLFTLELFILRSNYIEKFYENIKPECRLIVLEVVKNLITEQKCNIKPDIIRFFSGQFTKKSDNILKTCESYAETLDPVEIVKILDLLVTFSSDDKQCYLEIIQRETSLLINCITLLKNVHSLSKENGNNFSMITKLSECDSLELDSSVLEHPIFNFKCSLIRLIGNLCWKNESNQNKVRELDCIPVVLDCCNIDAKNPFIIQWCILAIRNICEKNIENQRIIASMSKEGKIDAARLQEIGIMLNANNEGDALCIAPLELKK